MNLIISACGSPDDDTMLMISNDNAKKYIQSLPQKQRVNFGEAINCSNQLAVDLLDKMLDMNPKRRITVEDALKHPYLESLHDPEDEPLFESEIDFSFEEDPNLTLDDIKKIILKEISHYNAAYYDLI